jgi:hypothetical protein
MRTSSALLAVLTLAVMVSCKPTPKEPPKPNTESSAAQPGAMPAVPPTAPRSPDDEMTAQLKKLAGADAQDCGNVPAHTTDVQPASDCAMQANTAKKPFFVRYELPMPEAQMAIATARAADGKLYTVQYSSTGYKAPAQGGSLSDDKKLSTMPCPGSPLRLAASGRVTCFPQQQNAIGTGANPHGGAMGSGMSNPHGTMPPATGANPHGSKPPSSDAVPARSH